MKFYSVGRFTTDWKACWETWFGGNSSLLPNHPPPGNTHTHTHTHTHTVLVCTRALTSQDSFELSWSHGQRKWVCNSWLAGSSQFSIWTSAKKWLEQPNLSVSSSTPCGIGWGHQVVVRWRAAGLDRSRQLHFFQNFLPYIFFNVVIHICI